MLQLQLLLIAALTSYVIAPTPEETFSLEAFISQTDEVIKERVAKRDFPPGLGETVKKFSKKIEQLGIYNPRWCRCSGNDDATMCLITCVSCDLHCPRNDPQCIKQCLVCAPRCHGSQACLNSCLCNKKCSGDASCESRCLKTGAYPFKKGGGAGPQEGDTPNGPAIDPKDPLNVGQIRGGRPNPPLDVGLKRGRPNPPLDVGLKRGRPNPPLDVGLKRGRPNPTLDVGLKRGRPNPPLDVGLIPGGGKGGGQTIIEVKNGGDVKIIQSKSAHPPIPPWWKTRRPFGRNGPSEGDAVAHPPIPPWWKTRRPFGRYNTKEADPVAHPPIPPWWKTRRPFGRNGPQEGDDTGGEGGGGHKDMSMAELMSSGGNSDGFGKGPRPGGFGEGPRRVGNPDGRPDGFGEGPRGNGKLHPIPPPILPVNKGSSS